MVDFIGVYEKTCPPDMCKEIIDFFEDNKDLQFRGRTVLSNDIIVNPKIKDSKDITLSFIDETVPSTILTRILTSYTPLYIDTFRSVDLIDQFSVEMRYNIQRYNPGQGYHLLPVSYTHLTLPTTPYV